jgi:3-carboxy-cis,cis-muconate cycloisomerase
MDHPNARGKGDSVLSNLTLMQNLSAYDRLFRSPSACRIFSEDAHIEAMLSVEAALVRAEARLGIIPVDAARVIESCCVVGLYDKDSLAIKTPGAGNMAIPLVKQLTLAVRERNPQAAKYVHWGATSQDVIDTAFVLQLRQHFDHVSVLIDRISNDLASLAEKHRRTLVAGRTWLQHAVPITFGLKAAGWLDSFLRYRVRLSELRPRILVLQFGGAAGTLAALGANGTGVASALAEELDLSLPSVPWHANRDRIAEIAVFHGVLMGTIGKIARDLSLEMQPEIGELAEPIIEERGGSSTMPQKRNPVTLAALISSALRVPGLVSTVLSSMVQEHERGLGGWQAEWETVPAICALTLAALERFGEFLPQLEVMPDAMSKNLGVTNGQIVAEAVSMALAAHEGRDKAHVLVAKASRHASQQNIPLLQSLFQSKEITAHLGAAELETLLDPSNYLGSSSEFIDAVLSDWRSALAESKHGG